METETLTESKAENFYEQKRERKLERYQQLKLKAEAKSQSEYEKSSRISEAIPFGQPILVGHHSEKRHRRDVERIRAAMDNSIKEKEKAEYYANKEANILNPTAISSDNPNAIRLLKEKMGKLQAKRERIKELKKTKEIPSYVLANLSQNINRIKKRVEGLERMKDVPETEKKIGEVLIKTDKIENRVKIFFPSIPSEAVRTELKRSGFRWSYFSKCWQRQLSNSALFYAEKIIREAV